MAKYSTQTKELKCDIATTTTTSPGHGKLINLVLQRERISGCAIVRIVIYGTQQPREAELIRRGPPSGLKYVKRPEISVLALWVRHRGVETPFHTIGVPKGYAQGEPGC